MKIILDLDLEWTTGFTTVSVLLYFLITENMQGIIGFPGGSDGKESTCNARDLGSIPGLGRSLGEGNGYPFQYSGLENSMDYIVHGVNFHFTPNTVTYTKICF